MTAHLADSPWIYLTGGPRQRVLARLVEAGVRIDLVVAADPNIWPKVSASLEIARMHGIRTLTVKKREVGRLAELLAGKRCVSLGFPYILPRSVVAAADVCLNVHGTLLPSYPGARSLNWVIENGERQSGITVHRMDEGIDTGPILLQERFDLDRFETTDSLTQRIHDIEPEVTLRAIRIVESGQARYTPQNPAGRKIFPDRRPEHSRIDPALPLRDLYDKIRSCPVSRFPAYFMVDGQKVCIRLWRPDKGEEPYGDLRV